MVCNIDMRVIDARFIIATAYVPLKIGTWHNEIKLVTVPEPRSDSTHIGKDYYWICLFNHIYYCSSGWNGCPMIITELTEFHRQCSLRLAHSSSHLNQIVQIDY